MSTIIDLCHLQRATGLALAMTLALAAAAEPAHGEAPPPGANAFCPVDPGEPAEARFAVEHAGQTVYLCCGRCARQFRHDPERYIAELAHLPRIAEPEAPVAAQAERAHAEPEPDLEGIERIAEYLGRFHVLSVHFPIGLLIAAAVSEMLGLMTRRPWLHDAARFCVWGGAIGTVIAVPLGWLLLGGDTHLDDFITAVHRQAGTVMFFWAIVLVVVMEIARHKHGNAWSWAYRLMLLGGAALVGITGHFGGMMVHGTDYLQW